METANALYYLLFYYRASVELCYHRAKVARKRRRLTTTPRTGATHVRRPASLPADDHLSPIRRRDKTSAGPAARSSISRAIVALRRLGARDTSQIV